MRHNYRAPCAQSLCPAAREATTIKSLHAATREEPLLATLEKAREQQQRPRIAKKKQTSKYNFKIRRKKKGGREETARRSEGWGESHRLDLSTVTEGTQLAIREAVAIMSMYGFAWGWSWLGR